MVNSIIDEKTGLEIHYGTIYGNDVSGFALDDIIQSGRNLSYEEALKELKNSFICNIKDWLQDNYLNDTYIDFDQMFESIEQEFNDHYESSDDTYLYEGDGYEIEFHTYDNSLIILQSPYVCYAAQCSPCFLNGGYIKETGNVLTYCLDHDFYDEDNPCQNEILKLEDLIKED